MSVHYKTPCNLPLYPNIRPMQTRHHDGNSKAHKCNHHLGQFFPASLKTEVVISAPGAAQPSLEDASAAPALPLFFDLWREKLFKVPKMEAFF